MTSAPRPHILVVTPSLPHPALWGFGIRVYKMIAHLAERYDVSVLAYSRPDDGDRLQLLTPFCREVRTVPLPDVDQRTKRRDQVRSVFSMRPYQRALLFTDAMQQALDQMLAAQHFDAVQIESSHMTSFRFNTDAKLVLDEHNIEYELLQRMWQEESAPARKLFNWIEYRKERRAEQRAWRTLDACILTSQREQEIVQGVAPAATTVVVPNGVDTEYFQPVAHEQDPNLIVFTGLMRYRPNADAAVYFAREVLPHIRRRRPQATFAIVGAGIREDVAALAGPNVIVTGTVPDVRPYVAKASVFAVPLRMGSGTRLKVLEGLVMEKAMVSTTLGCEGIDVRAGEHLLIADEPEAFARAVLRLMEDRALAAEMGKRGRSLVVDAYSWQTAITPVFGLYEQLGVGRTSAARKPESKGLVTESAGQVTTPLPS